MIQLLAPKTSTPTDASIDVIHGLVKCLTQNEVPPPSLPSVRIYAFRLLSGSVSRRACPSPPSFPAAFGPLSMLSSSILCLAKSSCKYEYMDHVSHFHVSASLSRSLSYLVASRRWRRSLPPLPPSADVTVAAATASTAYEPCWRRRQQHGREQLSARYFDGRSRRPGRTSDVPPPPSPAQALHQHQLTSRKPAAPPALFLSPPLACGSVSRRRAFLRPSRRPAVTLEGERRRGSWLSLGVRPRVSKTQP